MLNEWLNRLSKRESILLMIAVFMLVFMLAFFISRLAYESRSSRYLHSIIKLQNDIETMSDFINNNKSKEDEYNKLNISLRQLRTQKNELDSNLQVLKINEQDATSIMVKSAKDSGCYIFSLTPVSNDSSTLKINIVLIGNFNNIMQFLDMIEDSLYVDYVNISKEAGALRGEFGILILK